LFRIKRTLVFTLSVGTKGEILVGAYFYLIAEKK
jgi:hypothetical protein